MNRVNWRAKHDYEFIANMKILQSVLDKVDGNRSIDIERVAKAKVNENMEFVLWLKKEFDKKCTPERISEYNPEERRGNIPIDLSFADKSVIPKTFSSGSKQ